MKKLFASVLLSVMAMGFGAVGYAAEAELPQGTPLNVNVTQQDIKMISNVVFSQVPIRGYENVALKMDVLVPQLADKKATMPAIVFVTGGGFVNANKDNYLKQRMILAERGYVVASIQYRVAPTVRFPSPVEDVKAAVRYLRSHADKFHINGKKIGLYGGSAGGYLVAMAGTTNGDKSFDVGENLNVSSDVQAVVDVYGISDLFTIGSDYSEEVQKLHMSPGATEALWVNGSGVFGGIDGGIMANQEAAKAASPVTHVDGNEPPFLIMHGDKDVLVSPSQSARLYAAMKAKGDDATYYNVVGAAHGGVYWVQPEIMDIIGDFFDKHLK